mgnify:CR=1 FL=1
MVIGGGMSWFGSDDEFVGSNPDESASINYWLARRHLFGDLKIEVYNADGKLADQTYLFQRHRLEGEARGGNQDQQRQRRQ